VVGVEYTGGGHGHLLALSGNPAGPKTRWCVPHSDGADVFGDRRSGNGTLGFFAPSDPTRREKLSKVGLPL